MEQEKIKDRRALHERMETVKKNRMRIDSGFFSVPLERKRSVPEAEDERKKPATTPVRPSSTLTFTALPPVLEAQPQPTEMETES